MTIKNVKDMHTLIQFDKDDGHMIRKYYADFDLDNFLIQEPKETSEQYLKRLGTLDVNNMLDDQLEKVSQAVELRLYTNSENSKTAKKFTDELQKRHPSAIDNIGHIVKIIGAPIVDETGKFFDNIKKAVDKIITIPTTPNLAAGPCPEKDVTFVVNQDDLARYGYVFDATHGKVNMNNMDAGGYITPFEKGYGERRKFEHDNVIIGQGGFVAVGNFKVPSQNNQLDVPEKQINERITFINKSGNDFVYYYDKAENNTYVMMLDKDKKLLSAAIVQGYEPSKAEVYAVALDGSNQVTPHELDGSVNAASLMSEVREKVLHGDCADVVKPKSTGHQHHPGKIKSPCDPKNMGRPCP